MSAVCPRERIGHRTLLSWLGLLRQPLRVDRRSMGVYLGAAPGTAVKHPGRSPVGRAGRDLVEDALQQMAIELKQLLDRYPPSRKGLPALAFVERGLRAHGALLFEELEVSALHTARCQLERLVVDWSPRGLADLRSRLAIAVAERNAATPILRDTPVMSNFWVESRLSVDDASLSAFDEIQRQWAAPTAPLKR